MSLKLALELTLIFNFFSIFFVHFHLRVIFLALIKLYQMKMSCKVLSNVDFQAKTYVFKVTNCSLLAINFASLMLTLVSLDIYLGAIQKISVKLGGEKGAGRKGFDNLTQNVLVGEGGV